MKRFHRASKVSVCLVFCMVSLSAFATSFVVPSDAELIQKSDAIITGVVASSRVVESETGFIETVYEIAVTRALKGQTEEGSFITVRSPGGNVDGRFLLVESAAHFIVDEEVLLFLSSDGGQWTPTDMTLGKFRPRLTTKGYSVLIRDDEDIVGWTRDGRSHVEKVRLEADFIRFIEDTVRGHANRKPYEADATEVIAPGPAPARGGRLQLSDNTPFAAATYSTQFPACGETRYGGRWPTVVMDAGVAWFKNETNDLTGADDGGVSAIRAGLAAWTTDGGSAVNITYAGTGTELALDDSKNHVVFNDPQSLIAGNWTGSGVIATAYLYGSGAHTFDGDTFLNIVDADIVFQNGYTASELSLEEAITHEIGHALGIRHSNRHFDLTCTSDDGCAIGCGVPACNPATEQCSTTSIMNATVINNLGYVLQGWDKSAANALYPAVNAVPLPPTNVLALDSTESRVFVSWSGSDGATRYSVWRWENGAYVLIGEPSPNPASTSFLDMNSLPNRAYLYAVKAHNASGDSGFSGYDVATTVVYTDRDLTAGMLIKAVHLTELRTAANLIYDLVFTTVPAYTDPTIVAGSTTATAVHFQEVESVLVAARDALGLSVPSALGITAGGVIPVAHILALRSYAQ